MRNETEIRERIEFLHRLATEPHDAGNTHGFLTAIDYLKWVLEE